jgi:thioredoxin 2
VDQVAREHAGTVITLMLNTEQEPAPAMVHGVRGILTAEGLGGIPTFIVFRAGREVARRSGMLPRPQFSRWLESAQRGASVASSPM